MSKLYKQFNKDCNSFGMLEACLNIEETKLIDLLKMGNFGEAVWHGKKASNSEIIRLVQQNGLNIVKSNGLTNERIGKVTKEMLFKSIEEFPEDLIHPFGAIGFSIQLSRGIHYGAPITFAFIATNQHHMFTCRVVQ